MIYELAKELGLDPHSLFGAVRNIANRGLTLPPERGGISVSWERDEWTHAGEQIIERHSS